MSAVLSKLHETISFLFTQFYLNYSKLIEGDCGQILYYKSSKGICRPMGLFVGEFLSQKEVGEPIYQAIILNQAFKDIEYDYPHQLRDIQLCDIQLFQTGTQSNNNHRTTNGPLPPSSCKSNRKSKDRRRAI